MGLLDSNTFDPEKDVPDLTGKVIIASADCYRSKMITHLRYERVSDEELFRAL